MVIYEAIVSGGVVLKSIILKGISYILSIHICIHRGVKYIKNPFNIMSVSVLPHSVTLSLPH